MNGARKGTMMGVHSRFAMIPGRIGVNMKDEHRPLEHDETCSNCGCDATEHGSWPDDNGGYLCLDCWEVESDRDWWKFCYPHWKEPETNMKYKKLLVKTLAGMIKLDGMTREQFDAYPKETAEAYALSLGKLSEKIHTKLITEPAFVAEFTKMISAEMADPKIYGWQCTKCQQFNEIEYSGGNFECRCSKCGVLFLAIKEIDDGK